MADFVKDQLQQAYQLIKAGDKKAALAILRPLCQQHPDNEDAWWLAAFALDDIDQARAALRHVLQINPFNERAQERLDKLNKRVVTGKYITSTLPTLSVPKPETQNLSNKSSPKSAPKQNASSNSGMVIGLLVVVVLLVVGAIGFFVLSQNDSASTANSATLPSPTRRPIITVAPSATAIRVQSSNQLGPTWTPAPSATPYPTRPTFTPVNYATRVLSTADPALYGDTYWDGLGDGRTMDTWMRSGGRYLRYYEFPIGLYTYNLLGDDIWNEAVEHAIAQVSSVVPIQRVHTEGEANITIFVMTPDEYQRWSGCPKEVTGGCASIADMGDIAGGDRYHRIVSDIYINSETSNPIGVVLHELLHALGLKVHSPNPDDIMYPSSNGRTTLSQRDLNTLRRLYANPSYAD